MKSKEKVLIFAGTSDGRALVEDLAAGGLLEVHVCVATDYGAQLLPQSMDNVIIHEGRLEVAEMQALMDGVSLVLDATHPYADKVTANIKEACQSAGADYARLLREEASYDEEGIVYVENTEEAIDFLNKRKGKVLLTVGSKELPRYKSVKDWQDRIYARVLPMKEVIASCIDEGFQVNRLIAMQGPFSKELNVALVNQIGAKIIVTKDGGRAGGFLEKLAAAQACYIKLLVIGRPNQEEGYLPTVMRNFLRARFGQDVVTDQLGRSEQEAKADKNDQDRMAYFAKRPESFFPVFYDSKELKVLIVGGGAIASRRVKTLAKFQCQIKVIASQVSQEIKDLAKINKRIEVLEEDYQPSMLEGADMVLAATGNPDLNNEIARAASRTASFYNSASDKEECNFFFPAVIVQGDMTIGMTAQGRNHGLVKRMRKLIEGALKEEI